MDFFKSILHLTGVSHRLWPRPIALESSALGKLPLELILYISRFLPPESALSFSLCCRSIYMTFGTRYFKAIQEDEQFDRYTFLTLLERELPNYISCYYCKKLHAINKAHRHIYSNRSNRNYWGSNRSSPCREANFELRIDVCIYRDFSFIVFQMMMKLYRQGLDHSKLLSLLSGKTETHFRDGYVQKSTALAQIVAGSLLIRQQRISMIPPTRLIPIPWDLRFVICPHIQFTSTRCFDRYKNIFQMDDWEEVAAYHNQERIIPCKYCLTEFQIDFKRYGERGNAMFVTKWQDLGQGRSPLDHKWQSHTSPRIGRRWQQPVEFDRGSICAAFEGKEHFRFEFDSLLTPQDWKELFRESPYSWPKIE